MNEIFDENGGARLKKIKIYILVHYTKVKTTLLKAFLVAHMLQSPFL